MKKTTPSPAIFERVLLYYATNPSIDRTAKAIGVSSGAVRKVLLTLNVIKDPVSESIKSLMGDGMTRREVAGRMGVSSSYVDAHLPYSKGTYLTTKDEKTANALRLGKRREESRKEAALRKEEILDKYERSESDG